MEPKQSEHFEAVGQEEAVTVKEISTSELDLVVTPTVAPATPHYDTEISYSSSIIKSVLQNKALEQNNTGLSDILTWFCFSVVKFDYLRNKTSFLCLHSLVKTEANVWVNLRADQ